MCAENDRNICFSLGARIDWMMQTLMVLAASGGCLLIMSWIIRSLNKFRKINENGREKKIKIMLRASCQLIKKRMRVKYLWSLGINTWDQKGMCGNWAQRLGRKLVKPSQNWKNLKMPVSCLYLSPLIYSIYSHPSIAAWQDVPNYCIVSIGRILVHRLWSVLKKNMGLYTCLWFTECISGILEVAIIFEYWYNVGSDTISDLCILAHQTWQSGNK